MNKTCPSCGQPLPPDAPGGLCPQCLLARGFKSDPNRTSDYVPFDPPSVGDVAALFPQLEILELLGAGGMGAVYKARQPALDRLVALKILPKRDDPAFAERFTREARALAKLSHPGIVTVHDFGQAGELFYFVMECVDGVNLRQAEKAGKLAPSEALAIVPQICAALQFAHDAGVVHRDIKPENILLDAKGRVKIADFGLAKLSGAAGPNPLTHTHQVMGTIHYMAPEQWEKPNEVDHRADIYSLGVVFYELLTGELPLGRFPLPSERVQIDVRLDDIVLRTLQKQPERRYQHASEVKTAVENVQAAPVMPPPAAPRKRSIGWVALIVACVMMLLMCAGITSLMLFPSFDVIVDVKMPRELIIGSWEWTDGRVGTSEFRADGTFEERFREKVPDVKVGELIDPENQKLIERDSKLVGQYKWATHDVIWVSSPGRAPRQVTVVVTEDELTLKENDGGVHRMKKLSPNAANATTLAQQSLFGKWTSTVGDLRYEFLPNSVFIHTARIKADPQSLEVEKGVTCRYRWQDDQTIEFRPADGAESEVLELHFAKEDKTWSMKGPRLRIKFIPEHDGFVVLKEHGEVGARLKRDQAK